MKGLFASSMLGLKKSTLLMMLVLSWSSAATTKSAWAVFNPSMYIIGGALVPLHDPIAASTVALLSFRAQGMSLCTGSIIDTDLIVTAAHCVGPSPSRMLVFFGKDLNSKPDKVAIVTAYLQHSEYGAGYDQEIDEDLNDIALVRFDGGIPAGYAAAEILEDTTALQDGVSITLAGFGRSVGDVSKLKAGPHGSGTLRKVDTTLRSAMHGKSEVLTEQSMGKGACHGDSGGPAFVRGSLWRAETLRHHESRPV